MGQIILPTLEDYSVFDSVNNFKWALLNRKQCFNTTRLK